ncbi:MAG: hypothetical protein WEB03_13190, partial [Nitriliruptor sp.]
TLVSAIPAAAVGVAEVDLSVDLPQDSEGRPQLDLTTSRDVDVRLTNLADDPRSVRLYAVAATPTEDGSFALGNPTTATWFGLADQEVELAARERVTVTAAVRATSVTAGATHVAVVLEAGTGTTLVTRAARVIELGEHSGPELPTWLVALALLLIVLTLVAHGQERRGRGVRGSSGRTSGSVTAGSS